MVRVDYLAEIYTYEFLEKSLLQNTMLYSSQPSTLIPYPRRITTRLLLLPTRPIAKPALLPPAPPIPILFIKLSNRAQTAHILTDTRADFLQRLDKMLRPQGSFLRVFVFFGLVLILGVRGRGVEFLSYAGEGGGDAEVFQVGAGIKGRLGREVGDGDVRVEEFGFEVDFQNGFSVFLRGEVDEEAAGQATKGGFVEVVGTVGGDHDEGGELSHAVPFAEELIDEFAVGGPVLAAGTRAEDGVGFIDENDTGGELFG